jgi:hypothetical protein
MSNPKFHDFQAVSFGRAEEQHSYNSILAEKPLLIIRELGRFTSRKKVQ